MSKQRDMKQKIYTITYVSEVDGDLYTENKVATSVSEANKKLNAYIQDIADNFNDWGEPEPENYTGGGYENQWTAPNLHTYLVSVEEHEIEINI